MSVESVERDDLEPILATHPGNQALARSLQQIAGGDDLLRVLGRYIHFNSVFGGGVANLAGEIAVRQVLFRDPDEEVTLLADRSVDVAADIFFAAVDEFDDRATTHRDTHRALAQATLKEAALYFDYAPIALNDVVRLNEATLAAIGRVRDGYGISQMMDESKIFQAIGFHLGSEILADEEFRLLDGFLRERYPALVDHLQKAEAEIGGVRHPAYFWIQIHTSVEADHFASAVTGANRALRCYAGQGTRARAKNEILAGFGQFAGVQAEFMVRLAEPE